MNLKINWQFGLILYLLFYLLSCSSSPRGLPSTTQRVVTKAEQQGFSLHRYTTSSFVITAYERLNAKPGGTTYVYIEGDGKSWKTKYKISHNPTPHQPLALSLAILDPHPDVVYLARPCQYTPLSEDKHCTPEYWSSHRFAPEVIQAMNEVLEQIKAKTKNTHFVLIGFSGGASVVALLASERSDILGLMTVAGDLDHQALSKHHHTTPMTASLNPATKAKALKHLPQHHWVGDKDPIVPVWVAEQFAKRVDNPSCVKVHILNGATHHQGWEEKWPTIIKTPFACS
jgi:pimeloyl-ACP methyl ester carboxylesterase